MLDEIFDDVLMEDIVDVVNRLLDVPFLDERVPDYLLLCRRDGVRDTERCVGRGWIGDSCTAKADEPGSKLDEFEMHFRNCFEYTVSARCLTKS